MDASAIIADITGRKQRSRAALKRERQETEERKVSSVVIRQSLRERNEGVIGSRRRTTTPAGRDWLGEASPGFSQGSRGLARDPQGRRY